MEKFAAKNIRNWFLYGIIFTILYCIGAQCITLFGTKMPIVLQYICVAIEFILVIASNVSLLITIIQFIFTVISIFSGLGWHVDSMSEKAWRHCEITDVEFDSDAVYRYWKAPFMKIWVEGVM